MEFSLQESQTRGSAAQSTRAEGGFGHSLDAGDELTHRAAHFEHLASLAKRIRVGLGQQGLDRLLADEHPVGRLPDELAVDQA
jgi:hypothetical protein